MPESAWRGDRGNPQGAQGVLQPRAGAPAGGGGAGRVQGRYTHLAAQAAELSAQPWTNTETLLLPGLSSRLPIPPTERCERAEVESEGPCARCPACDTRPRHPCVASTASASTTHVLALSLSLHPALGIPGVSTRKGYSKVIGGCYLNGVNRPLGFLSPARCDQEESKQQLTSLPGVRPRAAA